MYQNPTASGRSGSFPCAMVQFLYLPVMYRHWRLRWQEAFSWWGIFLVYPVKVFLLWDKKLYTYRAKICQARKHKFPTGSPEVLISGTPPSTPGSWIPVLCWLENMMPCTVDLRCMPWLFRLSPPSWCIRFIFKKLPHQCIRLAASVKGLKDLVFTVASHLKEVPWSPQKVTCQYISHSMNLQMIMLGLCEKLHFLS